MSRIHWSAALCVLSLVVFVALFRWAYQRPEVSVAKVNPEPSIEGRYGNYIYTVNSVVGQREQIVNFRPPLLNDDTVVIGGLRQVVRTMYSEPLIDAVQPVVETLHEQQYVTFTLVGSKIYFQLFKDSRGQVGSARFWRDLSK